MTTADLAAACARHGWALEPDGDGWTLRGNGAPAAFGSTESLAVWLGKQGEGKRTMKTMPTEYINQIVTGDARVLAERIPDASVDLIFTDPPYPREYLPLYGWLAETAARVLKPGGYVFAYCGTETLPDVLDLMRAPGLSYFWTDVLLHSGAYPRVWYKKLLSGYKPVVVFTKGKPSVLKWRSTVDTASMDKRFHFWGQGLEPAIKTIEMLTKPDAIVFEPFAGGGTTAAACRVSNRNYIAFEIDPDTAERARVRVAATQAMHPVFLEEQTTLELEAA